MPVIGRTAERLRIAGNGRPAWRRRLGLVACLSLFVIVPGCGGCRNETAQGQQEKEKQDAEERFKKEKSKPKADFESHGVRTWPFGEAVAQSYYGVGEPYKPGHWTGLSLEEAKANNFDFLGDLTVSAVDRKSQPLPLAATAFELATAREIALPKGQPKTLESVLFVPTSSEQQLSVQCEIRQRKGGVQYNPPTPLLWRMPSYQYHFVVLARSPEPHKYLETIDSVKPPVAFSGDAQPYYRVTLLAAGRRCPLPSQPLFWTSIAYVLWDDAEPGCMDPRQQQAMLDWLHWGGQLLVSGPRTLDTLRGSFLAPYLPATMGGERELGEPELQPLNQWTGRSQRRLVPAKAWAGIRLEKHPQARFLPGTGELLAERRVGRGRIVVSAFSLGNRELTAWRGWDNVLNACLLRRPPRQFVIDREGAACVEWADRQTHRLDAARICNLRYFSRDAGMKFQTYGADVSFAEARDGMGVVNTQNPFADPSAISDSPPASGVAAWNDFSPVACAAREALLEAARIEIPDRSFVLWVMVGYVLVLVPANWAVFRLLGRVEWAWAAAPLVAVVCTLLVIRLAQLDIGFVRSRTEVAVMEIQGDYPRAHVSRYTALYSSLTTGYDLRFNDAGALVQPFPDVAAPEKFRMPLGMRYTRLDYQRGEKIGLGGFSVGSNSTGLVRSEEMFDLGGPLALSDATAGGCLVHNRTRFGLHDVGLVEKTSTGALKTAWLGDVAAGAKVLAQWNAKPDIDAKGRLWEKQRNDSVATAANRTPGQLNLRGVVSLAQVTEELQPGEIRLVGWLDAELGGLTIRPIAPQWRHGALVVAHLAYGDGDDPRPDVNAHADVERVTADAR